MWALLVGEYHVSLDDASRYTPRRFRILYADRLYAHRAMKKQLKESREPTQAERFADLKKHAAISKKRTDNGRHR